MIKTEGLKHEDFIQNLCDTYGRLKFDPNNTELKNDYEGLKNIILERMSSYSIVEGMELPELLTLEDVIVGGEKIDLVFNKLNEYLDEHVHSPKNLCNKDKAVFIIMMDNSGSMGSYEKYMAKVMVTWSKLLLGDRYEKITMEYIVHNTKAESVSEDTFLNSTESGGTIASSTYIRCLEIINSTDYKNKDIYVMHISDGDNLTSDNSRTENYLYDILNKANQVHYVETNQYNRSSTLMHSFKKINNNKFIKSTIKDKGDVLKAILDTYVVI